MRLGALRRAWLVASFALVAACSLTTSLDGYSSGVADVPETGVAAEAGVDASPSRDGMSDATIGPDGTIIVEAGTDTGPAPTGFCQGAPANAFFCNDFDKDPYENGWITNGSGIGPTSAAVTSAPRAFGVALPTRAPGVNPNGYLDRRLPTGTRALTLEFDLRIDDSDNQDAVDVGSIPLHGNPFWAGNLRYSHQGGAHTFFFFEFGMENDGPAIVRFESLGAVPKIGAFFHVAMTLQMTAAASTYRVVIDGVAHEFSVSAHKYSVDNAGVAVGVTGTDLAGSAFQGYVDNVLVTPAP